MEKQKVHMRPDGTVVFTDVETGETNEQETDLNPDDLKQ